MIEHAYFDLRSEDQRREFLTFLKEELIPIFTRAGCRGMRLYESTNDALSRYLLRVEFDSEDAMKAAMRFEGTQETTERFLEFVRDCTLVTYRTVV